MTSFLLVLMEHCEKAIVRVGPIPSVMQTTKQVRTFKSWTRARQKSQILISSTVKPTRNKMTQRKRLLRLVERNPGLTATGYTRLLGSSNCYKPATILKELHRFTKQGKMDCFSGKGMIRGTAYRFYPKPVFLD